MTPTGNGGDDGLPLGCHPPFPLVAHHLGSQHQIPVHHGLVAFEARAGWNLGSDRDLARHPIPFGAAAWAAARTGRPRLDGFLHAGGFERRARRQVLEPGDLISQSLVVAAQVAVVAAQMLDLLLQSIDLAGQIRDQPAQSRRGQGLGGTTGRGHIRIESRILF